MLWEEIDSRYSAYCLGFRAHRSLYMNSTQLVRIRKQDLPIECTPTVPLVA